MIEDRALVHRAAQLLEALIGLKSDVSFRPRLARALRDLAVTMNTDTEALVGALATDASLLDQLLDRVTVQETGFFRHPEQFETLTRALLPTVQRPFRAWSAACSNGQEAYSLAMLMVEAGGSGSVLGTDVSPAALQRTVAGRYHEREMRGVSPERRRRHFVAGGDGWQAGQNLREMVTVRRHNLLDPIPPQVAACQVVMCRNVLIYFTKRHAELFLERLADVMDPAAYLFVGAAEMLWQTTDRFEPVQIGGHYVYRPCRVGSGRRTTPGHRDTPEIAAPRSPVYVPGPIPIGIPVPILLPIPAPAEASPVDDTGDDHGRVGRQLLADGSVQEAIVAFRRWAYLSPDDPTAHFQLGSALDAAGARLSALRAYRAALAALDRCVPDRLASVLHGFDRSELRRLLADRCLSS